MRYILLAYEDENMLEAMSERECDALARACRENDAALRQSGRLLAAEALQSGPVVVVRVQNGAVSVADGTLAKIREQISAIFTIDARDLNEAIQVAATMPQTRAGPIEVRPAPAFDRP